MSYKLLLCILVLLSFFTYGVSFVEARIIIISNRQTPVHRIDQKRQVSDATIRIFERDLREKTGLKSLRFASNNELIYSFLEKATSGSEKMREAIKAAIDDELNIFQISDYSNSKNIQFAKTDAGTVYVATGITEYRVEFDFADFVSAEKHSDVDALYSFTLGITLFHEINHKVDHQGNDDLPFRGIRPDLSTKRFAGVIENTNWVRAELGLIERDTTRILGEKYIDNVYEIPFVDEVGNNKFLRWEVNGEVAKI